MGGPARQARPSGKSRAEFVYCRADSRVAFLLELFWGNRYPRLNVCGVGRLLGPSTSLLLASGASAGRAVAILHSSRRSGDR